MRPSAAIRGLRTTLVDVSDVALGQARALSSEAGVSLTTERIDLEAHPLPPGPWDLIVNVDFLLRPVLTSCGPLLAPGGLLCFAQPTVRNLDRHPHPSQRFLLQEAELPSLVPGLELLHYDEAWRDDGRHTARLLARRGHP